MSPIQQFKDVNEEEEEEDINIDIKQAITTDPEKYVSEGIRTYETFDLVEKIQQKFPKHELQFWEFPEISTCLPEVVVAIGIKVITLYIRGGRHVICTR